MKSDMSENGVDELVRDRVLIFEDDERQAQALQEKLAGVYEVDLAHDMSEALFLANAHAYAAVISDLFFSLGANERTPKGGVSLITKFRSGLGGAPAWGRTVPIIAVSGAAPFNGFDPLETAANVGANAVLRKPINTERLLDLLESLISGNGGDASA